MSIWTITERDVYALRGAGGEAFLSFCDSVLRAELLRRGVAATYIATNQRSTKPDGGVDTQVDVPVPEQESGWLSEPTAWQYKGTDASGQLGPAALESEISKPYSVELIRRGYAYRFAICDDVPAEKRREVDAILLTEARRLNPNASPPRLVTAGDLAVWASRYPAIAINFRNELANLLTLRAWGPSVIGAARAYVQLESRAELFAALQQHSSIEQVPKRVDIPVEGEPGIGKSRLVYEALAQRKLEGLVLYTNDEQTAVVAGAQLANSNAAAILVADECSTLTRLKLAATLVGHKHRVRLICIDAPLERSPFADELPWVGKMSSSDVDEILKLNFPEVSGDHRSAYREMARGYIRFAILLCEDDASISARGIAVALRNVDDYLTARITDHDQLAAAMGVSLFQRVGFRDDVASEMESVATLLDVPLEDLQRQLRALRTGPGFVAEAGRYYYVTPAIIAETLFARAWARWGAADSPRFLENLSALPGALLGSFLKRVAVNAPTEVRQIVGDHFRQFLTSLSGADLRQSDIAERLAVLVEAHPRDAAFLRRALEDASDADVHAVSGEYSRGWGARRTFVWLAEKLARYPDYFFDAEAILWRLASNENETVGNNATEQWRQLFRVYLSGAATPFSERIQLLAQRLRSATGGQLALAMGALQGIFSDWHVRSGGTVYIGGRLAPDDWQPRTVGDLGDSYSAALELLTDELKSEEAQRQEAARRVLKGSFWFLLSNGYLSDLVKLIDAADWRQEERLALVGQARDYVGRSRSNVEGDLGAYLDRVQSWIDEQLSRNANRRDLDDYLTQEWEFLDRDQEFRAAAQLAARAFAQDAENVEANIRLVSGSNPYRAAVLGAEVARLDQTFSLFEPLLEEAKRSGRSSAIGGYIQEQSRTNPEFVNILNREIDAIAEGSPQLAYEMSNAAPRLTRAFARSLDWVRTGALVPAHLKMYMFGVEGQRLTIPEVVSLLRTLMDAGVSGRAVAVEVVAYLVKGKRLEETPLLDEDVAAVAWALVETLEESIPAYNWDDLVTALGFVDLERAMRVAILGMTEGSFHLQKYAEQRSIKFALQDPEMALRILGEALSADDVSARFLVNTYRSFVKSLPLEQTIVWLGSLRIEAVRRFARHLEAPAVAPDGAVVPPLTEFLLEHYEADDDVFNSFYSGTHHLRMYSGDIAKHHDAEASVAERFRHHRLRRVREWAEMEIEQGRRWAEMWRQRNAEERSEDL